MEIVIRQAETKDMKGILEILNYEILNSTSVYDYTERTYEKQLKWFENKLKENMPVIIAHNGKEIVGYGTFGQFRPFDGYKFTVEHSIYVKNNTRAKGIGYKLMTRLIGLAKEKGLHSMIAGIDASNEKSINFHKKFCFKETGTIKEAGFKFDKWLDLVFMQLVLK